MGVAYLAITISATVLNSRRGRGFLSFALFCAIVYGLSFISGLYVYKALETGFAVSYARLLLPSLLQMCIRDRPSSVLASSSRVMSWIRRT